MDVEMPIVDMSILSKCTKPGVQKTSANGKITRAIVYILSKVDRQSLRQILWMEIINYDSYQIIGYDRTPPGEKSGMSANVTHTLYPVDLS